MAASTYITVALGLIVSALIARGLGPEDYGRYVYVLWLSGLLVTLGNHGLGITGIRFISEALGRDRPDEAAQVHGWLQKWQWLSLAAACGLFLLVLPMVQPSGWEGHEPILIAVVALSFMTKAAYQFKVCVAKGHGRFDVEAWSTVVMSVLYTLGVAVMMLLKASLTWYLVFFTAISVGHILIVEPMLRRAAIRPGQGECPPELVARMRPHLYWTIVHVGAAVLSNKTLETFLLNALIGPAEVGFFAIATNLTRGGVELVSSSLNSVLMPLMAHAYGAGGMRQVNVILSDAIRYCLFLGLILAGLGLLWAAFGIALMYGHEYDAVVMVLQIMVVAGGLTMVETVFGALLTTTDNQRLRAMSAMLSVGISVVTAITLVPLFGLMGAAWANAISRVIVMLVVAAMVVRKLDVTLPWPAVRGFLLSALLAMLAIAPLLWWSRSTEMQFLAGAVYVVVFVTCTLRLDGCWHAKDGRMLLALAERRPRQLGWLAPRIQAWLARAPF